MCLSFGKEVLYYTGIHVYSEKGKKTIQFMLSALCLTLKPMKTMSDILILRIIIIRKVKLVFILVECLKVIITIFTANV